MHSTIPFNQRQLISARELAESIFDRLRRRVWIELDERLPQTPLQNHVALGGIGPLSSQFNGDVRSMQHLIAQRFEPGEGGVFDDGFGESSHRALGLCRGASRSAGRLLRIFWIFFPTGWIADDVSANTVQRFLAANDVFVVGTVPEHQGCCASH